MSLTKEQIAAVRAWVSAGAGVSEVQKRLSEDFKMSMTYMDVRFLIDDIDAQIQNTPEPEEKKPENIDEQAEGFEDADETAFPEQDNSFEDAVEGEGNVSVTVSPIQRPGFMAFGDVVFSDGSKAEWYLDQQGQLGLKPEKEGHQFPQQDIPVFQRKLQELFRKMYG